MDALIQKLQTSLASAPHDDAIKRVLDALRSACQGGTSAVPSNELPGLRRDVDSLAARKILSEADLHLDIVQLLRRVVPSDNSTSTNASVVRLPQPSKADNLLVRTGALPAELTQIVHDVRLLNLLVLEPNTILPPGKSLLSFMTSSEQSKTPSPDSIPDLREKIEEIAHKSFWNEAFHSLSDPEPTVYIERLKALYRDIIEALTPLLPPIHPVLHVFKLPSPSTAPLRSALLDLRHAAFVLRTRCAPVRDAALDSILARLDDPSAELSPARTIVDTCRSLLAVATDMQNDMRAFELGRLGERDLWDAARRTAATRERAFVFQAWGEMTTLRGAWNEWLTSPPSASVSHWSARLVRALGASTSVLCLLPPASPVSTLENHDFARTTGPNHLPPPFFVVCSLLVHIQDLLQALVATAALRALVRLPPGRDANSALTARLWALLCGEVDAGRHRTEGTTLAHLADELVAARNSSGLSAPLGPEEEAQLRTAVTRTLSHGDPVFSLLQTRLLGALSAALAKAPPRVEMPRQIQAGLIAGSRIGEQKVPLLQEEERVLVKGFEDEALLGGIQGVLGKLRRIVGWVDDVWRDVIYPS